MRKLILQVQMSVDGYVASTDGEMDWMTWSWDEKLKNYVINLTDPVDTILLGRKMASGFINHWANAVTKPDDEGYEFAKKMIDTPKVVFTKTLERSEWADTEIAKGGLADEINKLKSRQGRDIIVYGGAGFVSSLIQERLVDEYHLFVNPAAIGSGMTIFRGLKNRQNLELKNTIGFVCGIAVLHYEVK